MRNNNENPKGKVSLLKILLVFLKIGAFTIGGGYVMLPIIKQELVERNHWLEKEDFYNTLALIQGLPGPVALNCSLLVAKKIRGVIGGVMASLGIITPSILIIVVIAAYLFPLIQEHYYIQAAFYGIRPAVTALIAAAAFNIGKDLIRTKFTFIILPILLIAGLFFTIHPIILIVASGLTGWIYYQLMGGKD